MCLTLANNKLYTAKKDITVYKRLNILSSYPGDISELHGKTFTKVDGQEITGRLSVHNNDELYLCSNDSILHGHVIENRFGYKYSYLFNITINSLVVDGKEILVSEFTTPYRCFKIKIGETYESKLVLTYENNVS